jgi:hypothetical protein
MMCRHLQSAAAVVIAIAGWPSLGAAQSQVALPSPLRLVDVVRIAGEASRLSGLFDRRDLLGGHAQDAQAGRPCATFRARRPRIEISQS